VVAGVKIVDGIFIYDNKKPKFQCKKYACDEDELMLRRLHENQWEVSLLKVQLKDAEQKLKALSDNYKVDGNLMVKGTREGPLVICDQR